MNRCANRTLFLIALLGFCHSGLAQADEILKFRAITHTTFAQSQDIGDVEGHVASLVRFAGLASFPDGTVGTVYFTAATDYTKGAGTFSLYHNLSLGDGSVLWTKQTGTATVDGTKTQFVGTVTVLGGKGRFEGAKGDGTLTATRYNPIAVGADLVSDYTITVRK